MASASNKAAGTSTGRSLWSKAMARILAMGLRMVSGRIVALSWAHCGLELGEDLLDRWGLIGLTLGIPGTGVRSAVGVAGNACDTGKSVFGKCLCNESMKSHRRKCARQSQPYTARLRLSNQSQ